MVNTELKMIQGYLNGVLTENKEITKEKSGLKTFFHKFFAYILLATTFNTALFSSAQATTLGMANKLSSSAYAISTDNKPISGGAVDDLTDKAVTTNDESSFQLNIPRQQSIQYYVRPSSSRSYVFGKYDAVDGKGVIGVISVRNSKSANANGSVSSEKNSTSYFDIFTPAHGNFWSQTNLRDSTIGNGAMFNGKNPFEKFKGAENYVFNNISLSEFMVVMGLAMKYYRTTYGLLMNIPTVEQTQAHQEIKCGPGCCSWTCGCHYWVYNKIKPEWMLALPRDARFDGSNYFYCADPAATISGETCMLGGTKRSDLIVASGFSFIPFEGGMMPSNKVLASVDYKRVDGMGFLGILLMIAVSFYTAGAINPALLEIGGASLSLGEFAAIGAAGYTAVTAALSGGVDIGGMQNGLFGSTYANGHGAIGINGTSDFNDPNYDSGFGSLKNVVKNSTILMSNSDGSYVSNIPAALTNANFTSFFQVWRKPGMNTGENFSYGLPDNFVQFANSGNCSLNSLHRDCYGAFQGLMLRADNFYNYNFAKASLSTAGVTADPQSLLNSLYQANLYENKTIQFNNGVPTASDTTLSGVTINGSNANGVNNTANNFNVQQDLHSTTNGTGLTMDQLMKIQQDKIEKAFSGANTTFGGMFGGMFGGTPKK
jgi:hypothetical protein